MRDMGNINWFLSRPLLDDAAAAEFDFGCKRIVQRHQSWRQNFPAVGLLLDSDEERAHALAGNYATQAREIVGVWLSVLDSDASAVATREERVEWVEGFWHAWRQHVFATEAYQNLERGDDSSTRSQERFTLVFEDLSTRSCAEAVAYVRKRRKRSKVPSLLAQFTAPLRAIGRIIEGFFFPAVRH